uniref:Tr-type G domain-containing protein n=1 Tax=Schistocephalus solidus TaxID=70667 RepID=A0A0X3NPW3_SCHSO
MTILSRRPLSRFRRLFSLVFQVYGRNSSSTSRETATLDRARIRNVGLIAHIDAGKTTTTERMLFLSGQTQAMGEVDRGDTVTDFLEEERERGISIMSATVCLSWQQHSIHLIDTPGHVDFTLEVERSLAVVDSALTIIDACKGVETQTRTVWNQADRHELPRLVFINKMDRPVADFNGSLKSLQRKLGQKRTFLPLHLPVFTSSSSSSSSSSSAHQHQQSAGGRFVGLVDLPRLDLKVWNCDANNNESKFFTINLLAKPSLQEFSNSFPVPLPMDKIMASALKAREHLISLLAELDEEFAEEYLSSNDPELLNPETINRSIRRATIASSGIPVLVGSSKQNIGVQLVMDALVQYLPDPSQRSPPPIISHYMKRLHNNPASASKLRSDTTTLNELPVLLVFKILFDSHWGALTLARVYSGKVIPGTHICNWTRQDEQTERNENIGRVLQLNGDSYKALRSAGPGCIVALTGLQSTRTGDVLGPPAHMFIVSETAKTPLCTSGHLDSALEQDVGFHVPGPVVHAALEPRSVSAIRGLERALARIQREDPSFTAS